MDTIFPFGLIIVGLIFVGLLCMFAIIRIHSNVTKITRQLERIVKLLEDRLRNESGSDNN